MTFLSLPLVEISPEAVDAGVGSLLRADLGLPISFVLSFMVILLFWTARSLVYAGLEQQSTAVGRLNLVWLLGIVFVPFPTGVVGGEASTSTTLLHLGTIAALAIVTTAITQLAAGPGQGEDARASRRHARRDGSRAWPSPCVLRSRSVVRISRFAACSC
jgi:uncharacterized membrane protein